MGNYSDKISYDKFQHPDWERYHSVIVKNISRDEITVVAIDDQNDNRQVKIPPQDLVKFNFCDTVEKVYIIIPLPQGFASKWVPINSFVVYMF
uniref:Uncharacterized protein n=1 Tax=Pithovirus LCPAC403 TaxID=2506596 RepID=A0A481ZAK9_9VIRU|nr:MAG: hypothetical protein LCPAC403_00970 [Pithovirus LCPAC403]